MLTIFLAIFVRLRSATEERLHLYLLIVVWLYISLGSKTHNYYIYFHILPRNRRHRIVIDAIKTRAYTFSDDAPSIACTDFWGCSPWAGPGVCRNDCPAAEAAAVSAADRPRQQRSWWDPFGIIARAFALPSRPSHDDGLRVCEFCARPSAYEEVWMVEGVGGGTKRN